MERSPVDWDPYLHACVVTGYEEALTVLLKFSADRTATPAQLDELGLSSLAPIAALMTRQMLFIDSPAHTLPVGRIAQVNHMIIPKSRWSLSSESRMTKRASIDPSGLNPAGMR